MDTSTKFSQKCTCSGLLATYDVLRHLQRKNVPMINSKCRYRTQYNAPDYADQLKLQTLFIVNKQAEAP